MKHSAINRRRRWALACLLIIPLINVFYGILNSPERGVHSLVTDLDREVPFVQAFIVPYLFWYVFLFAALIGLAFRDLPRYGRTLAALVLTLLASYAIYYGYQTTVPRPPVEGDDTIARLVRLMQSWDQPYNCFPSIHIATSYLMMRSYWTCSRVAAPVKWSVALCSLTIAASTFFLKQHVFLDGVGAVLVAEAAMLAVGAAIPIRKGVPVAHGS